MTDAQESVVHWFANGKFGCGGGATTVRVGMRLHVRPGQSDIPTASPSMPMVPATTTPEPTIAFATPAAGAEADAALDELGVGHADGVTLAVKVNLVGMATVSITLNGTGHDIGVPFDPTVSTGMAPVGSAYRAGSRRPRSGRSVAAERPTSGCSRPAPTVTLRSPLPFR